MKNVKSYNSIIISIYIVSILGLLISFYIKSNKNLAFILDSPKIEIKDAIKNYDFIEDPNNYLYMEIDEETTLLKITADEIIYKDIVFNQGVMSINILNEININGIFYKINYEEKTFTKIVWSEELKELTFNNGIAGILGLSIVIMGLAWVFLVYYKNMDILGNHRRLKTLISLIFISMIMLIISFVTTSLWQIFFVLTITFAIHYILWMIHRKKNGLPISEEIVKKVEVINGK